MYGNVLEIFLLVNVVASNPQTEGQKLHYLQNPFVADHLVSNQPKVISEGTYDERLLSADLQNYLLGDPEFVLRLQNALQQRKSMTTTPTPHDETHHNPFLDSFYEDLFRPANEGANLNRQQTFPRYQNHPTDVSKPSQPPTFPNQDNVFFFPSTTPSPSSKPALTFINVQEPVLTPIANHRNVNDEVTKRPRIKLTTPRPTTETLKDFGPAVHAPRIPQSQIPTIQPQVQPLIEIFPDIKTQQTRIPAGTHPKQNILRTPTRISDYDAVLEEELFKKQAQSAKYMFASNVDDTINENHHERQEIRDGVNVKGKYSYSDGYFKRTVYYEADDKGYRVVKEEVEPIGNGPKVNPQGHADVASYVDGNNLHYSITNADLQHRQQKQLLELEPEEEEINWRPQ